MEDLWLKAHKFILDGKVGDFYLVGEEKIEIVKTTKSKIYFSNNKIVTIRKNNLWLLYVCWQECK
jgi:hypothetical protein